MSRTLEPPVGASRPDAGRARADRGGWSTNEPDSAGIFGKFGYHPGLDGIRGLAMSVIFFFHAGSPLFPGATLSLSVFFTLSGFLITRLLLDEGARRAALDLPKFWARRLRRLLPAALAGVLLVLVIALLFDQQLDPNRLRGDVFGALGYVANWRFLFAGNSYAQLFSQPSPLLHYWSLAVEEQFYLLLPLVVWTVLRFSTSARNFRLRLRTTLLIGVGISLVVTWIAASAGNYDFVYYSLPSRAGELLIGGVAATVVSFARRANKPATWWTTVIGFGSMLAIGVLCTIPTPTDGWIGKGGLTAFALLSSVMIVTALPAGPFASMLACWPLRQLGRISYGLYLYHWPIILWLTPDRTGLSGTALVLVQAAVTIGLATVSFHVLEKPIRQGGVVRGSAARIAAPFGIVAMALMGFLVTSTLTTPSNLDFAAAAQSVNVSRDGAATTPATTPAIPGVPTISFFGDSTALLNARGFQKWADDNPTVVRMLGGAAWYGCGIVRDGIARFNDKNFSLHGCGDLPAQWGGVLDQIHPQLGVIQVGPIDADDHRLPGDTRWRALGDPKFDAYLKAKMLEAVDVFTARGVTPVWLTSPQIDPSRSTQPPNDDPSGKPARMARFNHLLAEVARERPQLVTVDLAKFIREWPGGQFDTALRPDGVHFDSDAAASKVAPWLGPAILRAVAAHQTATTPTPPAP